MRSKKQKILKGKKLISILIVLLFIITLIIINKVNILSKAETIVDINIKSYDEKEKFDLAKMEIVKNEETYSMLLPEKINGKTVKEYYIKDESQNEVKYSPNEKVILGKELEKTKKEIEIFAKYETKTSGETFLYKTQLEQTIGITKFTLNGFMPYGANIKISEIKDLDKIKNYILELEKNKAISINKAFDVKIDVENKEYELTEFDKDATIKISNLENIEENINICLINNDKTIEKYLDYKIENKELTMKAKSFVIYTIENGQVAGEEGISLYTLEEKANVNFTKGSGALSSPYEIANETELRKLAELVNGAEVDSDGILYAKKNYILTSDIELKNGEWIPIGISGNETDFTKIMNKTFQGTFNGNGHQITGIKINVENQNDVDLRDKYGLFGAIYSNDVNKKAMVYNLEIVGMEVNIKFTETLNKPITIGTLAGHLGKNSSIINCIVRNTTIKQDNNVTFNLKEVTNGNPGTLLTIGGVVGDASQDSANVSSSWGIVNSNNYYSIENCFADVDIAINDSKWTGGEAEKDYKYIQYNIGGIVGRVRGQQKLPKNCLYTGTITSSKAIIGPIYGAARYNVDWKEKEKIYLGINASGNSISYIEKCLYYNYVIKQNDKEYKNKSDYMTIGLNGMELDKYSEDLYYVVNNANGIGRLQGINRGREIEKITMAYSMFDTYVSKESNYSKWHYDYDKQNYTFNVSSTSNIEGKIEEIAPFKYKVNVSGNIDTNNITYEWYLNTTKLTNETTDTVELEYESSDRYLYVYIYENNIEKIALVKKLLKETPTTTIYKKTEGTIKKIYTQISVRDKIIDKDNYTYKWYKNEGNGYEEIENETNYELIVGDINNITYKVEAIEKKNNNEKLEAEYTYYDVIYVNQSTQTINNIEYVIGDDNNLGDTPEKAVQTLEKAYTLISSKDKNNNIVIIGNYNLNTRVFTKPATILGKYNNTSGNEVDYKGTIITNGEVYLNADTMFEDIIFDGKIKDTLFIYCQTNNLTMGEGVKTLHYRNVTEENAWGMESINYPTITILGGYLNYNGKQTLNKETNINILGGHWGRIIAGGRNESYLEQGIHKILGSNTNPCNVTITCDIKSNYNPNNYSGNIGLIVGGQADGACYINNRINVLNGKVDRILGANLGGGKSIGDNLPTDTFFGTTQINIQGGTVGDLAGGSLGRLNEEITEYFYGEIEINITGGTIEKNIFGGAVGGVVGYDKRISEYDSNYQGDPYLKYIPDEMYDYDGNKFNLHESKVVLNIKEGAYIKGNVYGAGYGYSKFKPVPENGTAKQGLGDFFGAITINITGGTIEGNVFGGAKGPNTSISGYNNPNTYLCNVVGSININVSGKPNINNLYGGGEGTSGFDNMALTRDKITININAPEAKITNIYGGGANSRTIAEITMDVIIGEVQNIYGAGDAGIVTGAVKLNLKKANVTGNVYGGGNVSTCDNVIMNLGTKNSSSDITEVSATGIYGGNNGDEGAKEVKSINEIEINILGNVKANITGGNNNSGVVLNKVDINLKEGAILTGNITGAGDGEKSLIGTSEKNAVITIKTEKNSKIKQGNIYGGGSQGDVYGNIKLFVCGTQEGIIYGAGKRI